MAVELRPGERLEVLREERRGVSVIEMISKNGRLVISEPMIGSGRIPVKKHDKLHLCIYRDSGMLSCVVTAEDFIKEGDLTLIEVEIRSKLSRYQRRDFVRFDALLPVRVFLLRDVENQQTLTDTEAVGLVSERMIAGLIDDRDAIEGITLDISGGGMRFVLPIMLEYESIMRCEVLLDNESKVSATSRIIRCERDLYEGQNIMGARFIGIEEMLRERVIKFIFAEQLKRRRSSGRR
jgi:c-di-GMP-binding flagellar brake protein YcgR